MTTRKSKTTASTFQEYLHEVVGMGHPPSGNNNNSDEDEEEDDLLSSLSRNSQGSRVHKPRRGSPEDERTAQTTASTTTVEMTTMASPPKASNSAIQSLSPFSPLVLLHKNRSDPSIASSPSQQQPLSLNSCRKVSVIVQVQAVDSQQVCLFPSYLQQQQSQSHKKDNTTDDDAVTIAPNELVVVNPTAFGRNIPSTITLERARLVSQVAHQSTADWIRSYRVHQVIWKNPGAPHITSAAATRQRKQHPPDPPLVHLARAMANDVTTPGSISSRTVVSLGHDHLHHHLSSNDPPTGDNHRRNAQLEKDDHKNNANTNTNNSANEYPAPTTALFGTIVQESVARVLATTSVDTEKRTAHDMTYVLERFGLLGLTVHEILQTITNSNAKEDAPQQQQQQLTLSVLEISQDELLDLQKQRPFHPSSAVQLVHAASSSSSTLPGLVGLTDVPIDSLKSLGRSIRRAFQMAYHPKRNKPRGHILAILKVWSLGSSSSSNNNNKCTVAQFLDLAVVVQKGQGPLGFTFDSDEDALMRRNAAVRQARTAVGAVLRGLLLKEAGNETTLSYRDYTLTQVLQKSLDHVDSKVIVLATVSPLSCMYSDTMATLRYVNGILHNPGQPVISPFDDPSKGTSPTSRGSTMSMESDDDAMSPSTTRDVSLLESMVSDPRQRMAKLLGNSASKRKKPLDLLNTSVDEDGVYVPTSYDDVDPRKVVNSLDRRLRRPIEDPSTAPTPLVRNSSMDKGANSFHDDDDDEDDDEHASPKRMETSLSLENMERGGYGHHHHMDEPSPLTTDTGEPHFVTWEDLDGNPYFPEDDVPPGSAQGKNQSRLIRKKSGEVAQMEHMSIELFHNKSLEGNDEGAHRFTEQLHTSSSSPFDPIVRSVLVSSDLDYYRREIERRDLRIAELERDIGRQNESLESRYGVVEAEAAARESAETEALKLKQELAELEEKYRVESQYRQQEEKRLKQAVDHAAIQLSNTRREALSERERVHETERLESAARHEAQLLREELDRRDKQIKALQHAADFAQEGTVSRIRADREREIALQDLQRQVDRLQIDLKSRDQEIAELQSNAEASKRQSLHSHDLVVQQLTAERDRFQMEAREAKRKLDSAQMYHETALRQQEQEFLELQGDFERTRMQARSHDDQVLTLKEELKRATNEARDLKLKLEKEAQERRRDAQEKQQEIEALNEAIDRTRRQSLLSVEENVAKLTVERDQIEAEARKLRNQLGSELESFQLELRRRDERIEELQKSLEDAKEEHRQARREVADTVAAREDFDKENESVRRQLESELSAEKRAGKQRELELAELRDALDLATQQLHRFKDVDVVVLSEQRENAMQEARAVRKELQSELENHRLELMHHEKQIQLMQEQFELSLQQLKSSHAGNTEMLRIELEQAQTDAKLAKEKLERSVQKYQGDTELLERQIVDLRETIALTRREEESKGDQFSLLIAEREKAERDVQALRKELDRQHQKHELDLQSRDEELRQMQETMHRSMRKLQLSHEAIVSELKDERETLTQKVNQELLALENKLESANATSRSQQESVDKLQEALATSLAQRMQDQEEFKLQISVEREKAENASSSLRDLESELETYQQEADRRSEEMQDLEGVLSETKYLLDQLKEESNAEVSAAVEEARQAQEELRKEQARHREELNRRDEDLQELIEMQERDGAYVQDTHLKEIANLRALLEAARGEAVVLDRQLRDEMQNYRSLAERRGQELAELSSQVKNLESEKAEVVKIAEEAIATQAELEGKVTELEEKLLSMKSTTVPKEMLTAMEEAWDDVSRQLQAAKSEIFHLRSESNDLKASMPELQFTLRNIEKERDHLLQRESEGKLEVERLRAQLRKAMSDSSDAARLAVETKRLQDEIEAVKTEGLQQQTEFSRLLEEKDRELREAKLELDGLQGEFSRTLGDLQSSEEVSKEKIAELQRRLKETEASMAEFEVARKEAELQANSELAARQATEEELEYTRSDLERLVSDVKELTESLKTVHEEKTAAEEKVDSLKRALSEFQENTKARVKKFVHDKSETKLLLQKTLEENESVVEKNRKLQLALERLQQERSRIETLEREHTEALQILEQSQSENRHLKQTIEILRESLPTKDSSVDQRFKRDAHRKLHNTAEGLLRKTLDENVSLSEENQNLRNSLLELEAKRALNDSLQDNVRNVSRMSNTDNARISRSSTRFALDNIGNDLIAQLALSAKKTVERSNAERDSLEERLRAQRLESQLSEIEALNGRVRVLEYSLEEVERGVFEAPIEGDPIETLKRRVRVLEKRFEDEGLAVPRSIRRRRIHD